MDVDRKRAIVIKKFTQLQDSGWLSSSPVVRSSTAIVVIVIEYST